MLPSGLQHGAVQIKLPDGQSVYASAPTRPRQLSELSDSQASVPFWRLGTIDDAKDANMKLAAATIDDVTVPVAFLSFCVD